MCPQPDAESLLLETVVDWLVGVIGDEHIIWLSSLLGEPPDHWPSAASIDTRTEDSDSVPAARTYGGATSMTTEN